MFGPRICPTITCLSMPTTAAKSVVVAVGVVQNARGEVLIAKRAEHLHQGGLWEFPGGKVEAGETVAQALVRELGEELGIAVKRSEPLLDIQHDYGDKQVTLCVHTVQEFAGQPQALEGQPLRFVAKNELVDYEFPVANRPILSALLKLN